MVDKVRVAYVDPERYTVDLESLDGNRDYFEVPLGGLYGHNDHQGGVVVMPEVDSYCYVHTDEQGSHHIMGFSPTHNSEAIEGDDEDAAIPTGDRTKNYRRRRQVMEPGDVFMGTADGNQIWVRRGGLIQIEATPLAQTVYIPIHNVIRHYFQQLQGYSPLGEFEWSHPTLVDGENIVGSTDSTPVVVKYSIKRIAQEDVTAGKFSVELRVGKLNKKTLDPETDGEHLFANKDFRDKEGIWGDKSAAEGAVSLVLYSHETEKTVYSFQLSSEGDLFMRTAGDVHVELDKTVFVRANDKVRVDWGPDPSFLELLQNGNLDGEIQEAVLRVLTRLRVESKEIAFDCEKGTFNVSDAATVALKGDSVYLGANGNYLPVLRDNGVAEVLGSHIHTIDITLTAPECAGIVNGATGAGTKLMGLTGTAPGLSLFTKGSPSKTTKSS